MASNYTEHYQLPIWSPDDPFLREEFNESHQKIDSALKTIPKITVGNYIGTGEYGEEHPNRINFEFIPKLVIISATDISDQGTLYFPMTAAQGARQVCSNWNTYSYRGDYCVLTWQETALSWYSEGRYGGAGSQYNISGQTYYYLAIG